jgi:hypothetical protein
VLSHGRHSVRTCEKQQAAGRYAVKAFEEDLTRRASAVMGICRSIDFIKAVEDYMYGQFAGPQWFEKKFGKQIFDPEFVVYDESGRLESF